VVLKFYYRFKRGIWGLSETLKLGAARVGLGGKIIEFIGSQNLTLNIVVG